MNQRAALQETSAGGSVTPGGAVLAGMILEGGISVDDAIRRAADHLLTSPRVEVVVSVLTSFTPDDTAGWARLGGRAWIRE